ncbi:MAG: ATP-dependent RecD-like DNA helicase [Lachnospiraceae bacterium]|nr:ATP-dependent RecD-like DNA helicase [Lachnospiraceae bacterium]
METIRGFVDHIIYQNKENGYTVFILVLEKDGDELTCTGTTPYLSQGETIEAQGQFTIHPTYGRQFAVTSYMEKRPEGTEALERYLGSGAIKGVGMALAGRIIRHFRDDTMRIIEEEPERLAEIKGISLRKAREIASQMEEKKGVRQAMMYLSEYGITPRMSMRIYERYGMELYRIIRENPYRLADDITGIGFATADEIARRAGIEADSDFRIRGAILYILSQASGEGHMFLPEEVLSGRVRDLLQIEVEGLKERLMDLAIEHRVSIKQEEGQVRVYTASAYQLELGCARMLRDLNVTEKVDTGEVRKKLGVIEKKIGRSLDERQRQAVEEAAGHGVLILTGGPGTGKTTTINAMIEYFRREGMSMELAAPTGRAAKRMTEATGYEARTIHRLLEVQGGGEEGDRVFFERNADNPIDKDVIIVDEMSMVDIYLLHALLLAVPVGTRLILVGDVNQLPSVGPGCVLRDLISSGVFEVVRLTRIFRQAEESDIVMNAHRINQGEHPTLDNKSRDFFFLKRNDPNVIISIVIQLLTEKMPRYVGARVCDVQVLTATRKGVLGVERLNRILQTYVNPADKTKHEHMHGDTIFREGDKVMQIHNNYQLPWEIRGVAGYVIESGTGIFNGDTGVITRIDEAAGELTVLYDDCRHTVYPFNGLDELELAYAVTVHKSQGSEYPAVIIPLLPGPHMLMNRNLLYTAITRAKSCVTLVGDAAVFDRMIDNTSQHQRYTTLALRIRQLEECEGESEAF